MSKERELLKECYFYIDNKIDVSPKELLIRIDKLLAQPEQEPEPVAIVLNDSIGFDTSRSVQGMPLVWLKQLQYGDKLYTAPPKLTLRQGLEEYKKGYAQAERDLKQEPLSDEEIYIRCCAMDSSYTCNFIDGVEWAEQQHGIGGGE